ncbi:MAG TPA: hypothetical protein VNO18_02805, partial [Xanthobacteraceae bacterium]|nr:hypothetical protein [Xanthobacteraceae bacterium]
MRSCNKLLAHFSGTVATALLGAASLVSSPAVAAPPCQGPAGTPAPTQTKCLTAVPIPGNPLRSFDISFVNPDRAEYYLADRSNSGIDIIDTHSLKFKRTIGGFVGIKLKAGTNVVDNNHSGPDGVVTHGRWLYAGDGNSTLKVIDLNAAVNPIKDSISTGGTTRVDEMDLTTDGKILLVANNAEDPPFGTLFRANGDAAVNTTAIIAKILVSNTIIPAGAGLSIEQPAWDPKTKRFYVSIPTIANNPPGCTFGPPNTCSGGLLVIDPATVKGPVTTIDGFNPATNTGVVPLTACGPNGATVGPHDNLLLGCTPNNLPSGITTLVINAKTKNTAVVVGINGSDEVWFNKGDGRYYLGASAFRKTAASPATPVLGVVDGTSVLIETIPTSSGSHSVAADSRRNLIFVPQVAPAAVVGAGGDTTTNGAAICGTQNGCIAVYEHDVD